MPVETVELEISHRIQLFLEELLRPKVAGTVDHQPPVSETRRVLDFYAGYLPVFLQLADGLQAVEQSRRCQ